MASIRNGLSLFTLLAILFIPQRVERHQTVQAPQVRGLEVFAGNNANEINSAPELASNYEPPKLKAAAAIAADLPTNTILYSSNMDDKLPIASLTKLMTALVVTDKLEMDDIILVEAEELNVIGSNMGLVPGEKISVYNLLKGLLIPSSNDAAKVLAKAVGGTEENFVRMMNEKAKSLGLLATHFSNPVGLDDPENYSTSRDLLKLSGEFVKDSRLNSVVMTKHERVSSLDGKMRHELRSTNKLLLENSNVIGIKTGYTSLAKGNLITRVNDGGRDVIVIVLNSDEREDDTRRLVNWVTQSYRW